MRSDITPGGAFPDYALPDHTGTVRVLSELQGGAPLVLMLSRGQYCPKEHQQHLELAACHSKVGVAFWGRPSVDDLWQDLRAATREIRPDWDLSTPGLRGAWTAGDRSPFHGWDRRPSRPDPEAVAR
jgi:hypothetical protein